MRDLRVSVKSGTIGGVLPEFGKFNVCLMDFSWKYAPAKGPWFYIEIPYELYPPEAHEDECEAYLSFDLGRCLTKYIEGADDPKCMARTAKLLREAAENIDSAALKIAARPPASTARPGSR